MGSRTKHLQPGRVNRGARKHSAIVAVPVSEAFKRRVESRAVSEGVTMAEIGRRALKQYLATPKGED